MIPLPSPEDFHYDLPEHKIASSPLSQRDSSKLLVYKNGEIFDHLFHEAPRLLPGGATLYFNETKVVMARLHAVVPKNNRIIEIFCLEAPKGQSVEQVMQQKHSVVFRCLVGGARYWKEGIISIDLTNDIKLNLSVEKREEGTFLIHFQWNGDLAFAEILEIAGKVPLPPYIKRDVDKDDFERYQTIFANHKGSVAAPTAGLHFTEDVMRGFKENGISTQALTLHVGGGTFLPIKEKDLANHKMHSEEMVITEDILSALKKPSSLRVAVGTTSIRFLESLYWMGVKALIQPESFEWNLDQWDALTLPQDISLEQAWKALEDLLNGGKAYAKTSLLIIPGYRFRVVQALFTNFHQPKSTLIMLIAAGIGEDWRKVYQHALNNDYRFLSYGDSNLYFVNS